MVISSVVGVVASYVKFNFTGNCIETTKIKKKTLGMAKLKKFVGKFVGPILTEFWNDRMAFGQLERTCLNIQNVPLL